jgi:CRP-like cAMP-binding protein
MTHTKIDRRLRKLSLFEECRGHELRRIAPFVNTMDLPTDHVLMHQGDAGRDVMVVMEGSALVSKDDHVIAEIGPGEVIGEIAPLVHATRTATVIAKSPMTVAIVRGEVLASALDASPTLAIALMRAAVRHLTDDVG